MVLQKNFMGKRIISLTIFLVMAVAGFGGCAKNAGPSEGNNVFRIKDTIVVDGLTRTYTLNLPPNYYTSSGFSLVIALHGGGGSAKQFERTCLLTEKANASGFVVVYPDGTGLLKTWNAGTCCGGAVREQVNDVKFISMLIDRLVAKYKINPKKVYATGHSNGGMMCYRLACELSDKIAAIAPNASTMVVTQACQPTRPVPILHMHSKLDKHVVYTGGYGNGISGVYCPPLDSVFQAWSLNNQCADPGKVIISNSSYTLTEWRSCAQNVTIQYYLTEDGGHAWPGGLQGHPGADHPSQAINANDLLWDFFQQYALP